MPIIRNEAPNWFAGEIKAMGSLWQTFARGNQGRWQGTRDLTIFTTDNGAELNRGIYQIGRGLAADDGLAAVVGRAVNGPALIDIGRPCRHGTTIAGWPPTHYR